MAAEDAKLFRLSLWAAAPASHSSSIRARSVRRGQSWPAGDTIWGYGQRASTGSGTRSARTDGRSGPYSTKVQQPPWIPEDSCGRPETVTCTDALPWTGCHCMACKRSGVRIPIAPPQFKTIIRNPEPKAPGACTAAKYSSSRDEKYRTQVRICCPCDGGGSLVGCSSSL